MVSPFPLANVLEWFPFGQGRPAARELHGCGPLAPPVTVKRSEPATIPDRGTPGCPPAAAAATPRRSATAASAPPAAPAPPPARAGRASCPGTGAAPRRTPGGGCPPGRCRTG